ncbi:MAG: TIGR03560 family F420-dependent LLM class oxidoreductase [Caldilineaceae bacterium]|nr:TIGR03560 family F420-dependent LLM class oxidoreductase [Caldilineaceae bacterium]
MPEIAINLEGQNGLNWPRWKRIAAAVEDLGYAALTRSDHFTNPNPPDMDSLELWVSLTWLADNTKRIEFGPLVSPVSFRHPAMTARMATAVDDLSGGRLVLGVGAGWQVREHHNFSYDLLDVPQRMARFEEGLSIIHHLLKKDEPLDYPGQYYQMHEAVILPRPQRPGGTRLLVGGNGPTRTLPLTATYADEWNGVFLPASRYAELSTLLDSLLRERGREPASVRRSLMTGIVFGRTAQEVEARLQDRDRGELRARGILVGTADEIADQVAELDAAGVQRLMLQWLDQDDIEGLEILARRLIG